MPQVYAVGPFYAHAEARKSPALDGKVERDSQGKEIRYPVILTAHEKTIANSIVSAFGVSFRFSLFFNRYPCSKPCAALTYCAPAANRTCAM